MMIATQHIETLRRTTPLFADAIFVHGKDQIDAAAYGSALDLIEAAMAGDEGLASDRDEVVRAASRILGESGHEWGDTVDFVVMAYALHVLARDERVTLNPEQVEAVTFRWRTLVQLTDWENDAPLRP